jgi:FMN phosphatase YigB (HAD superfamily)
MSAGHRLIATFDVYDTALTRFTSDPASVFLFLGRILAAKGLTTEGPESFARARMRADSSARRQSLLEDIQLAEVYAELEWTGTVPPGSAAEAAEEECKLERRLAAPVPSFRSLLENTRSCQQRILYISDMYLPRSIIEATLQDHGLLQRGDRVYVSSEHGRFKHTGRLLRFIEEQEQVPGRQFRHHGNDKIADVAAPRSCGWQVSPRLDANLTHTEQLLSSFSWETGGVSALLAGASRLARLKNLAKHSTQSELRAYRFGCSIAGPVLSAYVMWTLLQAEARGIRRLYFLARDGQILLRIARVLALKLGVAVQCRYLYASRRTWGLASIAPDDPGSLEWLISDPGPTLAHFFGRLSVPIAEAVSMMTPFGLTNADMHVPISDHARELIRNPTVQLAIVSQVGVRARAEREIMLGYLTQEGLLDGEPQAIVDVGWHGTLQACLDRILSAVHAPLCFGFYFGCFEFNRFDSRRRYHAYYGDNGLKRGNLLANPQHYLLLEMMTTGTEGSLLRYAKKAEGYMPVLAEERNTQALASGLNSLHEAVEAFANELWLDRDCINPADDCRPAISTLLDRLWHNPTAEEAFFLGSLQFEGGMADNLDRWAIARPYTMGSAMRVFLKRARKEPWHAGSLKLSHSIPARLVKARDMLGRMRKRVVDTLSTRLKK